MVNGLYLNNLNYHAYFRDSTDRGIVGDDDRWWQLETQVGRTLGEPPVCGYNKLILPEEYLL